MYPPRLNKTIVDKIKAMITHRTTESDCKRIAMAIMKEVNDIYGDVYTFGYACVYVSPSVIDDFLSIGRDKYTRMVNKYLKGCSASYRTHEQYGNCHIKFNITLE